MQFGTAQPLLTPIARPVISTVERPWNGFDSGHLLLFEFASYLPPKPTFCLKREVSVNVGLGRGRWTVS